MVFMVAEHICMALLTCPTPWPAAHPAEPDGWKGCHLLFSAAQI